MRFPASSFRPTNHLNAHKFEKWIPPKKKCDNFSGSLTIPFPRPYHLGIFWTSILSFHQKQKQRPGLNHPWFHHPGITCHMATWVVHAPSQHPSPDRGIAQEGWSKRGLKRLELCWRAEARARRRVFAMQFPADRWVPVHLQVSKLAIEQDHSKNDALSKNSIIKMAP